MRIAYLGNHKPAASTESHVAASFEIIGHEVTRIQEGEVSPLVVPEIASGHDLFLWTQTFPLAEQGGTNVQRFAMLRILRDLGIPTIGYHLDRWWGLARENQVRDQAFFAQDLVITADGGHQEQFASAGVNHRWLLPGVFEPDCRRVGKVRAGFQCDVAFVGNYRTYHPEWRHRRELIRYLRQHYQRRFKIWESGVRGQDLSDLYASAKVVIGDSCLVGNAVAYQSDRCPETLGRRGFLIHPHVQGVTDGTYYSDGEHLRCWTIGDWHQLRKLIDYYLAHEAEREQIAAQGQEHVLRCHTYTVRAQQILEMVANEGLLKAEQLETEATT